MGEHMIRYTHEHVLPRLERALAELRHGDEDERGDTREPHSMRCA
jgi:hypothetical protein